MTYLVVFLFTLLLIPAPIFADPIARSGCCSYHGGVCGCDNGRAKCCDGTLSPSCGCHGPMGKTVRRSSVRRAFLKSQGLKTVPKGAQIDHKQPLLCGGEDTLSNLWLLDGQLLEEKEGLERQGRCNEIREWLKKHPQAGK